MLYFTYCALWSKYNHFLRNIQGRSHCGRDGSPPNQQGPNKFQSSSIKHQGYCFLRMFRKCADQKFYSFYRVHATIFGQFMATFYFFLTKTGNRSLHVKPSEKVRYLTLDLLNSFFLWTIQKKTTRNESLNLRL